MAAKSCSSNLAKTLQRLRSCSSALCGYSMLQRTSCEAVIKSVPPSLGGASLHTLPGNRLLLPPVTIGMQNFYRLKSTNIADNKTSWGVGVPGIEELEDFTSLSDAELQKDIGAQINNSLEQGEAGRLFAVVYIRGNQHKVSTEDIIAVKYDFPPNIGDRIRLEKVLAVGGKDFTLIGQPLLGRDVVRVEATVVEKTLSHNRVWCVYRKRKNFKRLFIYRESFTMLVINSIQVAKVPSAAAEIEDKS